MAKDNTKLKYLSTWDIDQLIAKDEVAVGAGATTVFSIDPNIPLPVYELQFKPSGSNNWYQAGGSSSNNAQSGLFTFYGYMVGNSIVAVAPSAGRVRYYVWVDKVNY